MTTPEIISTFIAVLFVLVILWIKIADILEQRREPEAEFEAYGDIPGPRPEPETQAPHTVL